jgi:hypothetical protein
MNAPLERLERHGWGIIDGPRSTLMPPQYQDFIDGSRGEFSISKFINERENGQFIG